MADKFLTLERPAEGYYMARGSKFLAYAFPIENEAEALMCLQKIKKDHPKARHFCTAMRLFPDASLERSSDDGEPSGSAGKPILGPLIKNNLTNVLVIVVRYFGGTKLGVPGLIEAYKISASNAIQTGNIIERKVFSLARLEMRYEQFPLFLNFCKQSMIPIREQVYSDRPSLLLCFPKSGKEKALINALKQYSKMDFTTLEEYLVHLGMTAEFLSDEIII